MARPCPICIKGRQTACPCPTSLTNPSIPSIFSLHYYTERRRHMDRLACVSNVFSIIIGFVFFACLDVGGYKKGQSLFCVYRLSWCTYSTADKCIIILSRDFTRTDRVSSIRNVISRALNQNTGGRQVCNQSKAFRWLWTLQCIFPLTQSFKSCCFVENTLHNKCNFP